MTTAPKFVTFLRGDPDGSMAARAMYFVRNVALGAVCGFLIVAMATPTRNHTGPGFDLDTYYYGIGGGIALALLIAYLPRLVLRPPQDWPTRDEFRRGSDRPGKPQE